MPFSRLYINRIAQLDISRNLNSQMNSQNGRISRLFKLPVRLERLQGLSLWVTMRSFRIDVSKDAPERKYKTICFT